MKVAISIPDAVFAKAERVAAHQGLSRSALYARAVESYVEQHDPDDITERLNAMVDEMGAPSEEDRAWLRAGARAAARHNEW